MEKYLEVGVGCACVLGVVCALILYGYYKQYKKSTGGKPITFIYLVALFLFLSILPAVIPLMIFFAIYSQLVGLVLKIRYGSNFGGLLSGPDAVHALDTEDDSKNVGNVLFVVQRPEGGDDKFDFYEEFKKAILKKFAISKIKTPKLWYSWGQFLGYSYYIKNQITAEDCISQLERVELKDRQEITKDECVRLITKFCNAPLPKKHTALWEVIIGTQPIKWTTEEPKNGRKYYPVVLRIHHCLSDAASFVQTFIKIFADKSVILPPITDQKSPQKPAINGKIGVKLPTTKEVTITSKPFVFLWKTLLYIVKNLYVMIMLPPIMIIQNLIKATDKNILHGAALSGEKTLTIAVEELPNYLRGIKSRFPDTTLPEVFFAGMSSGLYEYFKKHSPDSIPETIAALVPVFPESCNLIEFFPDDEDVRKVICRNKFSLAILNLPITIKSEGAKKKNIITERLALIKKQINIFRCSIDYRVNYLVLTAFVKILPFRLRKIFSELLRCTFLISIVPAAPSAMTILDGYTVKDVLFWVPHRGQIGIGFSVFSYDDRLQIGLTTDNSLIKEERDAQMILDGIYDYLDQLNIETDYSRV